MSNSNPNDDREPRGDCFVAAYHYLQAVIDGDSTAAAVLVHGNLAHLPQGEEINHAWVEVADIVHEVSNGLNHRVPIDKYYQQFWVRNVRRYTPDEAIMKYLVENHYGAWET